MIAKTDDRNLVTEQLMQGPDLHDGARRNDTGFSASAAQSMADALARLPRTMPWSVQPAVIFRVTEDSRRR
jgi:hypothetical protein